MFSLTYLYQLVVVPITKHRVQIVVPLAVIFSFSASGGEFRLVPLRFDHFSRCLPRALHVSVSV